MTGRYYTDDEIQYIKENIDLMSYRAIGEHLGRSANSLVKLCLRLNIAKTVRAMPDYDVSNPRTSNYYSIKEREWIISNATDASSSDELYSNFVDAFGRSPNYKAFKTLLRRMKIRFPCDITVHKWIEDDIQFVRDNIDVMPIAKIGEKFGVSMSAMSHFCKRHGIHKSTYFYKGVPYNKS